MIVSWCDAICIALCGLFTSNNDLFSSSNINTLFEDSVPNSGNRRNLCLIPVADRHASGACFAVKKMVVCCFKLNIPSSC